LRSEVARPFPDTHGQGPRARRLCWA
jgi:hypothetical protein